jgi:hypothetical protein
LCWWARQVSNLWPLPCEGSAATTRTLIRQRIAPQRRTSLAVADPGDAVLQVASEGLVSGKFLATSGIKLDTGRPRGYIASRTTGPARRHRTRRRAAVGRHASRPGCSGRLEVQIPSQRGPASLEGHRRRSRAHPDGGRRTADRRSTRSCRPARADESPGSLPWLPTGRPLGRGLVRGERSLGHAGSLGDSATLSAI